MNHRPYLNSDLLDYAEVKSSPCFRHADVDPTRRARDLQRFDSAIPTDDEDEDGFDLFSEPIEELPFDIAETMLYLRMNCPMPPIKSDEEVSQEKARAKLLSSVVGSREKAGNCEFPKSRGRSEAGSAESRVVDQGQVGRSPSKRKYCGLCKTKWSKKGIVEHFRSMHPDLPIAFLPETLCGQNN